MVNPQLLAYVRAQRSAGVSKEEIVKALAGGGWSAQDAQEAFAAIDGPPAPPPMAAPKPPPPVSTPNPAPSPMSAMSPAMQTRPAMSPVQTPPMQPMSVRPQAAAVVQPRSVYAPQLKRRSKWPWVLLFLIIFFVLGAGAGAYAAVKYDWVGSMVAGIVGVEQPMQEDMSMVANEGDEGGFLEVSPDPFDSLPTEEENSTSTPATSTATSTATTTSGQ